ncbi:MAG: ABC transporter permease, partial [Paracoccaceae bacterium]
MTDASTHQLKTNPRSKWLDVWREFRNHKGAVAGAIIFFGIVLLVLIGPFLWPYEPNSIDIR